MSLEPGLDLVAPVTGPRLRLRVSQLRVLGTLKYIRHPGNRRGLDATT